MFTQNEFSQFIKEQLLRIIPSISHIKNPNDGTLRIFMEDHAEKEDYEGTLVNLHSPWIYYVNHKGDSRAIQKFLKDTKNALSLQSEINNMKLRDLKDNIFPSIRNMKLIDDAGGTEGLLYENTTLDEFITAFFLKKEKEKMSVILMKNQYKDIEDEEIKEVAYKNLRSQGWLKETEIEEVKSGKIIQYLHQGYHFNAQFFIQEWVEEEVGSSFYVSFPTRDSVYVYLPNKNTKAKLFLSERNEFISRSNWIHGNNGNPLSPIVYRYEEGRYTAINQRNQRKVR